MTIIIKAGDVTPEVAMKQAADFVKERVANGSRRAPGAMSQLSMTKKVSGLYVINIGKSEGFVIVSPDDHTDAILGYADSGNLNPDNMPDNMKAWLQGYADEIAWAKRNNITASATTAQRAHRAVKTAIAPLVTAQWNQSEPYNNKCPAFFEYGQCVTGCVATAMAQVLYYTATKAGVGESTISKAIAAYDCKRNWGGLGQIHVDEVEASTTFKWNKMKDTYTSSETGEADAVATLMLACGASVNMDYSNVDNGGSSANSDIIDDALKTYFGYDKTTQYADRSFYSYLNWIELLYNELSQGRAILYCGQSIGGGHEFVCDGYQGEDYFHINWGWGGKSDGFFKLAALDPDEQGIGGSTSTEGYNAGQSAVIGIQLKGGTGTVLDVHKNTVSLTLNDVSADKTSITTDEIANITFKITNNSEDIYDGEIGIKYIDGDLGDGKMFIIPAKGTKDCVVEFRPLATGTYKITAFKPNGEGGYGSIDASKFVTVTVDGGSGTLPSSSDLDLTASLKSIENANAGKTEVYGNGNLESTIKAVITITNPSTTTNFKGRFRVYMNFVDNPGYYYVTTKTISIPAGGSYDFEFSRSNVQLNKNYRFATCYNRTGSDFTSQVNAGGTFNFCPGIFSYNADGTKTVTKPSGTTFNTPSTALSVDLSGTDITTVSKNSNPNCLYILRTADTTPDGLTNVIKFDGTSYSADAITLTDGYDFQSPVDFTATTIEFTFANDRWADGTNGWNTIMLPFNVSEVTANGTAIDWFKSSSDTGKQFWLKEFTSDTPGVVNFSFTNEMKANTPYIIALPGNHWGAAYNLNGKTIKFKGSGTITKSGRTTVTAEYYRFMGQTQKDNTENIYCINAAGNKFEQKATGGSPAFRPYFKADIFDRTVTSLAIGSDETTGIKSLTLNPSPIGKGNDAIYDLQGRRIGQWSTLNSQLRPGLYIINGKKVIIKK